MNYNQFFVGSLTILFVALKLTNVITWSWWWVLSPLWIVSIFAICLFFILSAVKQRKEG